MGKPSAPPPPDYIGLAQQQASDSKDAAQYNAQLNRVNQYTPYGSLTYQAPQNPNDPNATWGQTLTLDPTQQNLLNQQNSLSTAYGNIAQQGLSAVGQGLGTPFDTSKLPGMTGSIGTGQNAQTANFGAGTTLQQAGPINDTLNTGGVGAVPSADDATRQKIQDALFSRLTPQFQQQEGDLKSQLLNSGIEMGSDAYNRAQQAQGQKENDASQQAVLGAGQEMATQQGLQAQLQQQQYNQALQTGQFGQQAQAQNASNTNAYNQALLGGLATNNAGQGQDFSQSLSAGQFGNQARQQSVQEQAYLRSLPLNEVNALRTGSQVTSPQFGSYYQGSSAQAPQLLDAGIAQGNYNAQAGSANQSGFNALLGGLGQLGAAGITKYSDRDLKTNIIRVGTHKLGFGIYHYNIGGKRERGVMADEVREIMPEAVHNDGEFDMVDYSMIEGVQ